MCVCVCVCVCVVGEDERENDTDNRRVSDLSARLISRLASQYKGLVINFKLTEKGTQRRGRMDRIRS